MSDRIELEDLRPAEGATSRTKRVGRGRSSGHGKTCCRGHNGEGQRSGRSSKRGFEGGQMPGYRQMPKLKGFEAFNSVVCAEFNVGDIEKSGMNEIDLDILKSARKARPNTVQLRILGNGELTRAVTVRASHFTKSAIEKIEKAGGKAETV
ncbi:MAG: 50S ribosomal protein L15 [Candidatus Gastranaerophilaceae bacterium]